ncbi:FAD-dependent oxidoreductase OS=Streptomyces tendae OX=1932 GN=GUR47_24895 PE=4 SV=1 [Streptomyces tendae]
MAGAARCAACGFDFVGTDPLFTGYAAQVTFADPDQLPFGFHLTDNGMYLRTPFPGHIGMMDFDGGAFDRSQPLTREHLQEVLRRITGTEVTLSEMHLASSFTDRAMQLTTYRNGRVLLAGDAAHIHSPLGGQGLNLAVRSCRGLLGLEARGDRARHRARGPARHLHERTPPRGRCGPRLVACPGSDHETGPNAPALRKLVHELLRTTDGTTLAYRRTAGLFNRYDLGDAHPLVGNTAPDFCFEDGTRLGCSRRATAWVLLDFGADDTLLVCCAIQILAKPTAT